MRDLLFLAHRIPFPPDKGDKIRAWHLLQHLSRHYRVHLGAFVDDPEDWRHCDKLRSICASTYFAGLNPRLGKLRALFGLFSGEPLTLPYYRHRGLQAWVDAHLRSGVERVFCYSSVMGRFVMPLTPDGVRRVMDFVDIDSDKWHQYAATKAGTMSWSPSWPPSWPLSWLYHREGDHLLAWERQVAAAFTASLFVSTAEAADFRALAPESAARIGSYSNGVDADYFSPLRDYPRPELLAGTAIVFTGAMDYWPNVDAVTWFAREVMPELRRLRPDLLFAIVGGKPAPQVRALAGLPGVLVTGRVADIRPWLAHASVVVAPLRIARGVQNKVLEGMAMGCTLVVSPQALEGLTANREELLVAEGASGFVTRILEVLGGVNLGAAARQRVLADYAWEACLAGVDELLQ